MPRVSVIFTSFNHGSYIDEAIDSVLHQSFDDFELIVWDDASTDDSWRLINQFADPRIAAFRNAERKRAVWGLNKAISQVASGQYIAVHHSDDVWEPDKLEKQVACMEQNGEKTGLVYCWSILVDKAGQFEGFQPSSREEGRAHHSIIQGSIIDNASVPLFRTTALA
jgi:glycosyltransferase involved in cell wall biosynthesis